MSQATTRWPLSTDVVSLREAMDRLVNESFVGTPFRSIWATGGNGNGNVGRTFLPLDVFATSDEVVILASVPGVTPDDLQITFDQGAVTIAGKLNNVATSDEAKTATWYLHELPYGTFQRSVSLPFDVDPDQAEAVFEHGILRMRLPKVEQARPKQIKVRIGEGASTAPEAVTAYAVRPCI